MSKLAPNNDISYDIFYNINPHLLINSFQYGVYKAHLKKHNWKPQLVVRTSEPYRLISEQRLPSAPKSFYRYDHPSVPPGLEVILFKTHISIAGTHLVYQNYQSVLDFISRPSSIIRST